MVEVIHAGRNATENDSIIVGDNIDEIVQYCFAYFGDTVPGVSVDTVPLSACSKVLSFSY